MIARTSVAVAMLISTLIVSGQTRQADGIALTSRVWLGTPVRWTVYRDGSIDDERAANPTGLKRPFEIVVRHAPPAPGRYARITHLLAPLRVKAGQRVRCAVFHSDDYYGRIVWSDGIRLDYDFGCEDPANRPTRTAVAAATEQVTAWMKDAPMVRRYQVTDQQLESWDDNTSS